MENSFTHALLNMAFYLVARKKWTQNTVRVFFVFSCQTLSINHMRVDVDGKSLALAGGRRP